MSSLGDQSLSVPVVYSIKLRSLYTRNYSGYLFAYGCSLFLREFFDFRRVPLWAHFLVFADDLIMIGFLLCKWEGAHGYYGLAGK